jgi:hypothetical protein
MVLGVVLALLAAPGASAGVHNLIPADAAEDPQDSFRADDALFFYATVDIKGGRVCIIHVDADPDTASCDSPAWGSPNTIGGLGTTYSLAEGPYLRIGTWRLMAETIPLDEGEEAEVTSISEPFTVSPCGADCDATLSSEVVTEFKAAAQGRSAASCSSTSSRSSSSSRTAAGASAAAASPCSSGSHPSACPS